MGLDEAGGEGLVVGVNALQGLEGLHLEPRTVDALPGQVAHRTHGLGLDLAFVAREVPSSLARGAAHDIGTAIRDSGRHEGGEQLAHLVFGHSIRSFAWC